MLLQKNKSGKNVTMWPRKYQIALKFTKIAIEIPNGLEVHQDFPSQGFPKCTEIDIFGLKTYQPSGNPVCEIQLAAKKLF
jgi:hypothetical protein